MIYISSSWSERMMADDHLLFSLDKISEETFQKYSKYVTSHMNLPNLAKILNIDYNPEPVSLRAGDCLIKVLIRGGKLHPYADKLPKNVWLEYYCYRVFDPNTHVIVEKKEIAMEE